MNKILLSLLLGLVMAIIDITPMIIKKLDKNFILSAFLFWIVMGLLVPNTNFFQISWLNGLATGLLIFLPVLTLIIKLDPKALPIVIATTVVLSSIMGYISGKLIS